jgi:hypothetical protein
VTTVGRSRSVSDLTHLRNPWGWLLVVPVTLIVLFNVANLVNDIPQLQYGGRVGDWYYWGRVNVEDPYPWEWVRWSPPAVWFSATIQPWAYPLVFLANLVAIATLPWRVALVFALSFPFWAGQLGGSFIPMIVVAAWHAIEGRRFGIVAFVLIAALIPRPIMLPVLGVLLWRYSLARWTLLGGAVFVVGYSLAVGQLDDWLIRLAEVQGDQYNLSPSALIGAWWYPIGLALAAFLTWKGWYGLASLAISPYLFSTYLLFGLLDLRRLRSKPNHLERRDRRVADGPVAAGVLPHHELDVIGRREAHDGPRPLGDAEAGVADLHFVRPWDGGAVLHNEQLPLAGCIRVPEHAARAVEHAVLGSGDGEAGCIGHG